MSYLSFVETGRSASGKTKLLNVMAGETWLGSISWYSPWRKYVFVTAVQNVVFDEACLGEIGKFIALETQAHKNAIPAG